MVEYYCSNIKNLIHIPLKTYIDAYYSVVRFLSLMFACWDISIELYVIIQTKIQNCIGESINIR